MNIDLRNAVIIIDEAHNIEDVASQAASAELSKLDIQGCIADLEAVRDALPWLDTILNNLV
jgi:Rad3-related DNA helicase